jgi:5'-3' exonuclease
LFENHYPSLIVIAWDGKDARKRRSNIFSGYKSNRGGGLKEHGRRKSEWEQEKDPNQVKEEMLWEASQLITLLTDLPVLNIHIDECEADDIISYLLTTPEAQNAENIVITTDKDYYQLINKNVTIWSPIKHEWITETKIKEDYLLEPSNFIIHKIIDGDKSDGIPGINGISTGKIKKFISPYLTENNTVEDLFEICEQKISESTIYKTILDNKDIIERNWDLMRLDGSIMSNRAKNRILNQWKNPKLNLNRSSFIEKLVIMRIYQLFTNINQWLERFNYIIQIKE